MNAAKNVTNRDENIDWDPQYVPAAADAAFGALEYGANRHSPLLTGRVPITPQALTPQALKPVGKMLTRGALRGGAAVGAVNAATNLANGEYGNAALSAGGGAAAYGASKLIKPPAIERATNRAINQAGNLARNPIMRGANFAANKLVPPLMAASSAASAVDRLGRNDYIGAGLDGIAASTAMLPGAGQAIGFVTDTINTGRDVFNNLSANSELAKQMNNRANDRQRQEAQGTMFDAQGNVVGGPEPSTRRTRNTIRPSNAPQPSNIAPNISYPPTTAVQPQPQGQEVIKQSEHMKKTALSQFKKDLEDANTGTQSDLYRAVSPLISSGDSSPQPKHEVARTEALRDQVRKGLVGLEYMTGLKSNTGETFYDKHPTQAVATDLLGKSPEIGAAVAAGGIGTDILRRWDNAKKIQNASDAREGNRKFDKTNSAELLDPAGRARPDISRVFGDFDGNVEKRLGILDKLEGTTTGGLLEEYRSLAGHPNEAELKKKIIAKAKSSPSMAKLRGYADAHQSLQNASAKGGLKGQIGESLHKLRGKFWGAGDFIADHIAPNMHAEIGDIFEKNKITGAHTGFDEDLIKKIVHEYRQGGDFSAARDPKGKAFLDSTLKDLQNKALQGSNLRKAWSRYRTPVIAGGAIAAGGTGLYHLIKAIQNRAFSDDQKKDWKKTLLQSRGEFDAANQVQ
jgi:hypothetical protein